MKLKTRTRKTSENSKNFKKKPSTSVFRTFAQYAEDTLLEKEENAFADAMKEKHKSDE